MLALFCRQNSSYHHFAVLSLYNKAGGLLLVDFVKLNPCIQETKRTLR